MNQPKFKVGDRVKNKNTKEVFIINHITLDRCEFSNELEWKYCDVDKFKSVKAYHLECGLSLFQEPQKKKLYAYSTKFCAGALNRHNDNINGSIITHLPDLDIEGFRFGGEEWYRSPDYDIEYPEVKG